RVHARDDEHGDGRRRRGGAAEQQGRQQGEQEDGGAQAARPDAVEARAEPEVRQGRGEDWAAAAEGEVDGGPGGAAAGGRDGDGV
ncbi:hypothetical protein LTR53_018699, partial [Teratosphaeriaceae sp. CCFEE 6253]